MYGTSSAESSDGAATDEDMPAVSVAESESWSGLESDDESEAEPDDWPYRVSGDERLSDGDGSDIGDELIEDAIADAAVNFSNELAEGGPLGVADVLELLGGDDDE